MAATRSRWPSSYWGMAAGQRTTRACSGRSGSGRSAARCRAARLHDVLVGCLEHVLVAVRSDEAPQHRPGAERRIGPLRREPRARGHRCAATRDHEAAPVREGGSRCRRRTPSAPTRWRPSGSRRALARRRARPAEAARRRRPPGRRGRRRRRRDARRRPSRPPSRDRPRRDRSRRPPCGAPGRALRQGVGQRLDALPRVAGTWGPGRCRGPPPSMRPARRGSSDPCDPPTLAAPGTSPAPRGGRHPPRASPASSGPTARSVASSPRRRRRSAPSVSSPSPFRFAFTRSRSARRRPFRETPGHRMTSPTSPGMPNAVPVGNGTSPVCGPQPGAARGRRDEVAPETELTAQLDRPRLARQEGVGARGQRAALRPRRSRASRRRASLASSTITPGGDGSLARSR